MKKMKTIHWILIAVAIYFLFIKEKDTYVVEPNSDADPNPQGRKLCSGNKCKIVRRRGVLGIGRQVAHDWCKHNNGKCTCLGNSCK
jgi:hypothetical protein